MLLHPNHSADYRNWAHCCLKIRELYEEIDTWNNDKSIPAEAYYFIKGNGKKAFLELREKQKKEAIPKLMRKISRYIALRNKLAVKLIEPEKHLLQVEDLLNMIGNVIDITPRHDKKRKFLALSTCSEDGTSVNGRDSYEFLVHGYGKSNLPPMDTEQK